MENKKRKAFIFSFRTVIVLLAFIGVYLTVFGSGDGFMSVAGLCFYTVQSNIWALLLEAVSLVFMLFSVGERLWFKITRLVVAVAITVTFLVFWTMLAPMMNLRYLVSPTNIILHTLVPLMTLADAAFIDRDYMPKKSHVLFCMIPPLAYLGFAMIRAEVSDMLLSADSKYPYWFLDVDKYSWFGFKNGVGVFYWVIVVVLIVLGLGYLIYALKNRINKNNMRKEKDENGENSERVQGKTAGV